MAPFSRQADAPSPAYNLHARSACTGHGTHTALATHQCPPHYTLVRSAPDAVCFLRGYWRLIKDAGVVQADDVFVYDVAR